MTKRLIKRLIEYFIYYFGPHRRRAKNNQLLILMYHRVLPKYTAESEHVQPGMYVTPDSFQLHLNTLKQYFTLVSLSDWLSKNNAGKPLPEKSCAITFDDGWIDNYKHAFPILQSEQTPATLFIVSDMIGTNASFWPERLTNILQCISSRWLEHNSNNTSVIWIGNLLKNYDISQIPLTTTDIDCIINNAKLCSDPEIITNISNIEQLLNLNASHYAPTLLDWSQIKTMTSTGLVEIGSHTRHHIRMMDALDEQTISNEICKSKDMIISKGFKSINLFCYPNGYVTNSSDQLVRHNYSGACTTQKGWNTPDTDPHLLRRIGVHNDVAYDKISFLARISGWM